MKPFYLRNHCRFISFGYILDGMLILQSHNQHTFATDTETARGVDQFSTVPKARLTATMNSSPCGKVWLSREQGQLHPNELHQHMLIRQHLVAILQ